MLRRRRIERFLRPLSVLAAVIGLGTVGFRLIEGWTWLDALYMTVITLATVGFAEVHPLDPAGRVFTIALIFIGIGVFTYLISVLGPAMFEEVLGLEFRRTRMRQRIAKLSGHIILCGCGRVGRLVRREFETSRVPFMVVERDSALARELEDDGVLVLDGDATSEATLRDAGIERARGLVTVLPGDAENLYVVITARDLNATIPIIARSETEAAEKRLVRAGATRVISPNAIGGRIMAQALLQPAVLDFLTLATQREHLTLQIEEVVVRAGSPLATEQLRIAQMRERHAVFVVAMRKSNESHFDIPTSDRSVDAGDTLIVVGRAEDCATMNRAAAAG